MATTECSLNIVVYKLKIWIFLVATTCNWFQRHWNLEEEQICKFWEVSNHDPVIRGNLFRDKKLSWL